MGRRSDLSKYLRIQSDLEASDSLWQLLDLLREDLYGCTDAGRISTGHPLEKGNSQAVQEGHPLRT